MGLLALILILIAVLILLELFKHHFTKRLMKYIVLAVVFIFILLIISAYFDLGSFFSKDNTFAKTGSVIAGDVKDDVKDVKPGDWQILDTLEDKTKEFFDKILD